MIVGIGLHSGDMALADQVLAAALELPTEERARIAHKLLLSLDVEHSEADATAAWTAELARRLQDVRTGAVELADMDEVDAYVEQRLAEVRG